MSNTLEEVLFIFCLHYPGDNHIDEMRENGLLWLTQNGYLGEICLRFLTSTINRTIYHTEDEDIQGDCRGSIAFTDVNMSPAPNKCGGDHNHEALQALTTDVLIETIRLCLNAEIVFFGKKPNQFAANSFLQRLKKEGLADRFPEEFRMGSNSFFSNCQYLTHSQFFLMQLNTIDHTKDLFQFVAYVIHAIFGKDIRDTLLTMDEVGIQQIVPFANQAMIEARSQAQSDLMIAYWSDPKNREAHGELMKALRDDPDSVFNSEEYREAMSEALTEYWSDPKSTEHREKLSEVMIEYWSDPKNCEALSELMIERWSVIPFNPNAKYHTRNQWRKSGQLLKPHQCAKCGTQYDSENHAYLHHMENCKHPTDVMMTSALLSVQNLPGNSPTTVKEDSKSKKKLEQRTKERRQRFITNKGNFHRLQNNLHK